MQRFPQVLGQLWKLFLRNLSRSSIFMTSVVAIFPNCIHLKLSPSASQCQVIQWVVSKWNVGLSQVGFWISHAKCAATAVRGNTTVFTPVTAARDSSRGASAETGPTSANLALRWGLLLIPYIYPHFSSTGSVYLSPFIQAWIGCGLVNSFFYHSFFFVAFSCVCGGSSKLGDASNRRENEWEAYAFRVTQ